ncbi:MAG: glycosyltransferase [Anaeromyxobacter sp.]|nr:glycosyltransferase [Anaeromyxobacter sp.]
MPDSPDRRPHVSIVLAVRDGWEQTFRTLLALVEATRGLSTETIVVDDGSSDETGLALPRLPGLQAVRADQPVGLVRARNQGAALARGHLVAFLGNGAVPTAGWLAPLLAAFEQDPLLGAAQPAAGLRCSDGLVVQAEVFRRLGGFDVAFRDRLAEVDLGFRLAAAQARLAQVAESLLEVTAPWGAGLAPWPADEALLAARWGARLAAATPPAPTPPAAAPAAVAVAAAAPPAPGPARPPVTAGAPQFSVLVPCYNQAHFLTAALDSLLAQTCGDWEALVVDDGSTDATTEVAHRYARQDPRFRPFRKANGGVASALNRGLAEARGEWVCWLSADDLFLPDKLEVHRDAIRRDPALRFMHTNFELLWQETGRRTPSGMAVASFIPPPEQQVLRFLQINYFNGITIALRRDVFAALGGFDEEFRYGQDYDVWLRASALVRSTFLDRPTAVTRLHPGQGTALFTEAGIYDSARAAAAFLNRHPLAALFPALDLDRPDHALHAVVAALRVALDPASFVARCGYAPALQDRLLEWAAQAPAPARTLVQRELGRALAAPATEQVVAEALRPLVALAPGGFTYRPHDPLGLLHRQAARVEAQGNAGELAALRRYLRMISDTRTRGLEASAP